ncbi:flagellar basal body rod protein FlgC [Blastopirellula marina]|uniref:Flagellar basal-body rod protein FlgC n=1 Tax=Blastopirellula marina TaxID=124 RepID=A0A2S8F2A4_9BACT|nr:flagellar basal body rod protein FlgC [Blastopirellula marina]PQO26270.1 flagellar basal body rod protein FlgC [Blastopirellula marina]PQO47149.1 flagellar basal body rod protein FlgC [Blastopirellula marina]PTL40670.1 flagellar basal body rod protein FlgC [Blastopirellula marina]
MNGALDISSSAMIAQRIRLNAVTSNIANMSSLRDENGDIAPYQARHVIFETDSSISAPGGASGVRVSSIEEDQVEPVYRYQPNHPLAITEGKYRGYVAYPRVNMVEQMVDALEASRAYEANIGVVEITKNLANQSLRLLA